MNEQVSETKPTCTKCGCTLHGRAVESDSMLSGFRLNRLMLTARGFRCRHCKNYICNSCGEEKNIKYSVPGEWGENTCCECNEPFDPDIIIKKHVMDRKVAKGLKFFIYFPCMCMLCLAFIFMTLFGLWTMLWEKLTHGDYFWAGLVHFFLFGLPTFFVIYLIIRDIKNCEGHYRRLVASWACAFGPFSTFIVFLFAAITTALIIVLEKSPDPGHAAWIIGSVTGVLVATGALSSK